MRSQKLTTIILIGMVLGILVGWACNTMWPDPKTAKTIADYISLVTDIFLRLIKMIIAPLVFSTLVVGVAHMGDTKAVGRIGGKAMLWFVGASLVSLLTGMVLVNILRPGDNLNLPLPDAPWHTHRDRIAEAASVVAIIAGTCGKIARDVSLLMQTDVGEAFEPSGEGRGGSSTMPHKRNPVAAASALAAANMAPNLAATIFAAQVQDHERSAGPWHAEWPTLPTLMLVTSGGLAAIVDIAEGLEVDAARMRANLDATHGLIMAEAVTFALADKIGKSDAHHLIEAASKKAVKDKKHLRDVLTADARITAQLDAEKIAKLFEPMAYQGASQALIDRLLASTDDT